VVVQILGWFGFLVLLKLLVLLLDLHHFETMVMLVVMVMAQRKIRSISYLIQSLLRSAISLTL